MKIVNGNLYTPDFQFHKGSITLEGDHIQAVQADAPKGIDAISENCCSQDTVIDAADCYVIPGLIDLHFHGCAGYDFCDGTQEALQTIARYQASQGITGICPASMTLSLQTLSDIMQNAHDYYTLQHSPLGFISEQECADFLGIHMEGPFLSAVKCGAQNPAFLCKPDIELFHQLQQQAGNLIKLVDVAPEEDTNYNFTREISSSCVVSLAHTAADYNTCRGAFQAGASHVTHLFNAMNLFSHREPGLIGAAFDAAFETTRHSSCDVELICDGIHLTPTAVRMAFKLFTDAHIILISDSMRAAGMPDGSYMLGGQPVWVNGTLAALRDGTIAGSVTHLTDCVRKAVSFGIPLESALRCATANPARSIGCDDRYGFLKPGYVANVVILDAKLHLKNVILRGKRIL